MNPEPILVQHLRPAPDDAYLKQLIAFLGLNCMTVDTSALDSELDRAVDQNLCILANAATIDAWRQNFPDPAIALNFLCQKAAFLFVYGFAPETSPVHVATSLSGGAIEDVRRLTRTDLRYEVGSSHPEITREFSGLSFGCVQNTIDSCFVCSANSRSMVPLVTIDGMPFWVVAQKNRCKAFLLACSAIADIQEQVNDMDAARYFSRLLPAAMFLRMAFKKRCWHSKHSFGNFIIDDPPLKRSYGYLNYRDLMSKMDTCGFASTIAFIPWNYRRTDSEVTQLFRERPDRLSLCVHGCDHTTGEFSSTDLALLNSRVQLASARMNSLHRQNGLPYSKTMVFPQGRFSTAALTALKSNNYLAAINSSASPDAGSGANGSLTVADFLEPAITRHGGVAVFLRRYPGRLEQFAFDLFFGKPLLVVEHHGYMKDGGARLAEFISRLNSFARLEWSGLHEIMTKSHIECEVSDEITVCRLNTNYHVIENHAERERTFIVTKFEAGDVPIHNVQVNGQTTKFIVGGNVLEFAMRIPPLSSAVVNIVYKNLLPEVELDQRFANRTGVWVRRMLSELRDNVLCRNELLLARAQELRRRLEGRRAVGPARPDHSASGLGEKGSIGSVSAPAKECVSASDLAREILGPDSGATISNVLVVGTNHSKPLKRMKIHFDQPKQVPAFFNLLATALKSGGFDFHTTRISSIPPTEIWLTCPLDDEKKTLLSCARLTGEQVGSGVAVQSGSSREQTD